MTRPTDTAPGRRPFPRRDPAGLDRLRARVRALEGGAAARRAAAPAAVAFGAPAIDRCLPWGGLPRGALHEVLAAHPGAATGFCAALCARLARDGDGAVLWCETGRALDAGTLYAPGLARFGLDPARVIAVRARRDADALWVMEEGLRCSRLAAVVAEIGAASLTATRRLQLAAEAGGVTALILAPGGGTPAPSAAVTRWRVAAAPGAAAPPDGAAFGPARWRAELLRCRGGDAAAWEMEWRDETGDFAVAAPLRDRPAVPRPARMAG